MKILEKILVQKETVSDVDYKITEIYAQSGQVIKKGDLIVAFETSKADVDIESPLDGLLIHNLDEKSKLIPGEIAVIIVDKATNEEIEIIKQEYFAKNGTLIEDTYSEVRISRKALELMFINDLSEKDFEGKKVVKEVDVLTLIEKRKRAQHPMSDLTKLGVPNESDVLIIGGKGGAKMVIDAIRSTGEWNIKGIIDDAVSPGDYVMGVEVLGGENLLEDLMTAGFKKIILSFSILQSLKSRQAIYQKLKNRGFEFPNVIHKRAVVEPSAHMGEGNLVLASAMIGSQVELGNINYVNTGALLCHDAKIGDNNHFAPNSVIAGRVFVEDNVLVGMCVTTFYDIRIGGNSILNNGVSVINDVPAGTKLKL
jgi:sugar O-acyltransferase (sialic acid O-acetyltransferase NeuD family)